MKPQYSTKIKYKLKKDLIIKFLKTKKVKDIAEHYGCSTSNIYLFCKKNKIKIPELDLIGKRWNMLEVIEKLDSRGGFGKQNQFWKCLCNCGQTIDLSTKAINGGKNISCGCWIKSKEYRKKSWCWTGFEDIHGKWWNNKIRSAKKRNHKFSISIQYAWNLFLKQKRKCALTGIDLFFGKSMKEVENGATTASLDRIDNKLGYIKGNVHWVHKDINFMKQGFDLNYFIEMCSMVAKKNRA